MTFSLIERISHGSGMGELLDLRVRIFRLVCTLAAVLCVFVIAPLNLFVNLPLKVDIANLVLAGMSAFFYWQSRRGSHFVATFVVLFVAILDVVWFWDGGSEGSITLFFFPVLLLTVTLFRGWKRQVFAVGLGLNVYLLFLVEYFHPGLVEPFQSRLDQLLDMQTGIVCSFLAIGSTVWLILACHDRDRQRISEIAASLAASQENYLGIFNSANDALLVHAVDGRVLDANERACSMFGLDHASLLQATINDLSLGRSPCSQTEAIAKIQLALAGQAQVFEWRGKRANGELFWCEVALRAWESSGGKRVVAAIRDISRRKKIEQERRDNEDRLRLAMVASRQGWFELNVQTGEGVSSPEYVEILGFRPDEFVATFQGMIDGIHPEDRDAVTQVFRRCVESGETSTVEYRRLTKSGAWKWIRSVGRIVEFDALEKPLRLIGMHMDITDRKELEAQLLHSQRLEAVGTLSSGVAHDLNNVLTPMLMATGLLRDKLADPQDRSLVTMIDESGKRGAAIVRQLLAFSRNLVEERVTTDLAKLLRDAGKLISSTFPKEIKIVESVRKGSYLFEAEPNQLHQVLLNLCVNARDAMPGGGTISLGLEQVELPPGPEAAGGSSGGPHFVISVADTGQGIPAGIMDRIFDPFFTTKPLGKGTGLGLASVHGIVKSHRGFLRVESTPGRGTIFRVYLPASAQPNSRVASAPPYAASIPPFTANPELVQQRCILVVDDDPAVLFVTGKMLEVKGYQVLSATTGAEALDLLRIHREKVGLVITDFSMPEMDGPTLAPLLRAIVPSLRIIGVSGLNQEEHAETLAELGFCEVLRKPYEFDDLIGSVKRHFPFSPTDAAK